MGSFKPRIQVVPFASRAMSHIRHTLAKPTHAARKTSPRPAFSPTRRNRCARSPRRARSEGRGGRCPHRLRRPLPRGEDGPHHLCDRPHRLVHGAGQRQRYCGHGRHATLAHDHTIVAGRHNRFRRGAHLQPDQGGVRRTGHRPHRRSHRDYL